jgi:hypothetical protein
VVCTVTRVSLKFNLKLAWAQPPLQPPPPPPSPEPLALGLGLPGGGNLRLLRPALVCFAFKLEVASSFIAFPSETKTGRPDIVFTQQQTSYRGIMMHKYTL